MVKSVQPNEVKVIKVIARLPSEVKTAPDFLKLVWRQNGAVDTARWAVLKQTPEGCLILGLDEPSLATLKNQYFRLSAGIGTTTFKLLGRDNTVETEKTAQEETQLMVK